MANRALLHIDSFAVGVAQLLGTLRRREATPIDRLVRIHGSPCGQPLVVSSQRQHIIAAVLWWRTIHGVGKAAGNTLLQVVDVIVLAAIVGQGDRRRPYRCTERLATLTQVAAGAVHVVEDILSAQLLGVGEEVVAAADHLLGLWVQVRGFEIGHGRRYMHQLALLGGRVAHLYQSLNHRWQLFRHGGHADADTADDTCHEPSDLARMRL